MIQVAPDLKALSINGSQVVFPYKISDAFECDGIIIVFLDPDANLGKTAQYKNLLAFNTSGKKLWEAELPSPKKSDVYWRIVSKNPLIVSSFSSYDCEIDLRTGHLIKAEFYK